jgi:hypothetical protein
LFPDYLSVGASVEAYLILDGRKIRRAGTKTSTEKNMNQRIPSYWSVDFKNYKG